MGDARTHLCWPERLNRGLRSAGAAAAGGVQGSARRSLCGGHGGRNGSMLGTTQRIRGTMGFFLFLFFFRSRAQSPLLQQRVWHIEGRRWH